MQPRTQVCLRLRLGFHLGPSVQLRAAASTGKYLGLQHFEYVNCVRDMRGGRGHCLGLVLEVHEAIFPQSGSITSSRRLDLGALG